MSANVAEEMLKNTALLSITFCFKKNPFSLFFFLWGTPKEQKNLNFFSNVHPKYRSFLLPPITPETFAVRGPQFRSSDVRLSNEF